MTYPHGRWSTIKASAGWRWAVSKRWADLRIFIRVAQGRQGQPSAAALDGRTLQSSCESGPRAGYDSYKRRGSKVHMAVDKQGYAQSLYAALLRA